MEKEIVQFIGVSDLDDIEKEMVEKITPEYYEKIKRSLDNLTSMAVHVKTYDTEGKKKRYQIFTRAMAPTRVFESKKAQDWDLSRALHKSFKDLERQIQHKLKTDAQKPTGYE